MRGRFFCWCDLPRTAGARRRTSRKSIEMGLCGSTEGGDPAGKADRNMSKAVDQNLHLDHVADQQVNKLLLLGAGGSGKSTMFKQIITIYGKGFPEHERKTFITIIHSNIILAGKTLCEQSATYGPVKQELVGSKKYVEDMREDGEITHEAAAHIKALWADPGIQATYAKRAKFQLADSCSYFISRLDEVAQPGYIPSEQDVLRSRIHTTGIVEHNFEIDSNRFKMLDVGGQRSERKKWVHCFENVTAVLFVAAISEYDQVLFEDDKVNRVEEALTLFEEITNSEWFKHTAMILFLNKRDLFEEKLPIVPLSSYYPDFNGGADPTQGCAFMKHLFESRCEQDKDVYTHLTCATDTNNIFTVFSAVKDIVIKKGLARAGLI